jgi:hypothetical protein
MRGRIAPQSAWLSAGVVIGGQGVQLCVRRAAQRDSLSRDGDAAQRRE